MRRLLVVLVALGMLGLASLPVRAESRVALVVGNSAYQTTAPLSNPLNDARDIGAALKAAGFDVVEALDADKRKLDGALRAFTDKLAQADVALFFYAGHGLQVGLQNYLLPIDAKLERERDLEFEAVKLDFVLRQMEIDREGRTTIVILDACRDNPLSRNLARSMGTRSASIGRGLAAASTGLGTFIAYSTQPGNVALDGEGRNSPFTSALVKQIGIKGRNLNATMIEVRKDVVAATAGRQVPWDHSALTGDFYFVPGAAAPAVGAVSAAPAGTNADVAALQERLRRLEDDARKREAAGSAARPAAFIVRSANRIEGDQIAAPPSTANCETRCQTVSGCVGYNLSRDGICELYGRVANRVEDAKWRSGVRADLVSGAAPQAGIPPVTPKAVPQKVSPNFEVVDNVGLLGVEIEQAFRAPNPIACREACEKDASCVGFQHGRKSPVMGRCELFSRIDARREDNQWRSGVRTAAAAASTGRAAFPVPFSRTKQGFDFYEGVSLLVGDLIKGSDADTADGCLVVCRNTPECVAATFRKSAPKPVSRCEVYRNLSPTTQPEDGATAIVRSQP